MGKYAVPMFADPAHTRAMTESALDVVARKHATLREELTESGELLSCDGAAKQGPDGPSVGTSAATGLRAY